MSEEQGPDGAHGAAAAEAVPGDGGADGYRGVLHGLDRAFCVLELPAEPEAGPGEARCVEANAAFEALALAGGDAAARRGKGAGAGGGAGGLGGGAAAALGGGAAAALGGGAAEALGGGGAGGLGGGAAGGLGGGGAEALGGGAAEDLGGGGAEALGGGAAGRGVGAAGSLGGGSAGGRGGGGGAAGGGGGAANLRSGSGAAGRRMGDILPDLDPASLVAWSAVARQGDPLRRLPWHAVSLGRWFEIDVHPFGPPGSGRLAVLLDDVTERRRAERAKGESDAGFGTLAHAMPQIVWLTDADGRCRFVNARWKDYTGEQDDPGSACEIVARHVHPDDRAVTLERFDAARATGSVFEVEHRIRSRSGDYRWFLVRGEPRRGRDGGAIVAWYGASTDIHDRRLAEAALAASEERQRLIVKSARDYGILLMDPEGTITDWWAGAEAVFGWPADEAVGRNIAVLFTEEDVADGAPERERRTAAAQGTGPDVRWHVRRDGSRVFIEGSVIAQRDAEGRLWGFLKIGQDVTRRREADARLRESEARFRQFGDASSDLLWIRDAATLEFEYMSPVGGTMLGLPGDDPAALRAAWDKIVLAEDRAALKHHLARLAEGERASLGFRIRRPDGEPRWLLDAGFPLRDPGGGVRRIAGITTDVTENRETRDRLRILVSELQHRTRNLLAVVQALAERTLGSSGSFDDFRLRFYPRLAALARVNSLLSRIEADERVTFDRLIRAELAAHGALDGSGDRRRVRLEGPTGIRLRSSTIQTLALALHELCTNSLKHGALAAAGGRLDLRWEEQVDPDGERRLLITWIEQGVAMEADAPAPAGFGRELIERALPRQLRTEVDYRIGADGVRCTISLPLSTLPSGG